MVCCRQKQTVRENDLEEGEMEESTSEEQQLPVRDDKWGRNTEALKYTTGLQDDLVYASFTSEHIPSDITQT